jgi:hypothetical protein
MRIHDANIVISHVNVFCLFEDTSSHMVLQCMKCNQELQHWDFTCLCLKVNGVNAPQTYSFLTFECKFMMLTLSFRMYMFFVCEVQSRIDTLTFDMFVFESILRSSDANMLCFDICITIFDAYIVFSYVNVWGFVWDTCSHFLLRWMRYISYCGHTGCTCLCS